MSQGAEPALWVSVETTLGPQRVSEGGVLKQPREPVLVLINPVLDEGIVSCSWLFTHPGLIPGDYPLTNGVSVHVPREHCSPDGSDAPEVTLEAR